MFIWNNDITHLIYGSAECIFLLWNFRDFCFIVSTARNLKVFEVQFYTDLKYIFFSFKICLTFVNIRIAHVETIFKRGPVELDFVRGPKDQKNGAALM
jgi:hypothetical protein